MSYAEKRIVEMLERMLAEKKKGEVALKAAIHRIKAGEHLQ